MLIALLGLVIGAIGTLIGAGGGFILVPILLALYPEFTHDRIAGISMAMVAFNATSGSFAYLRRRQVHLRAAVLFIIASLPGAVFGVWMEKFISRSTFQVIFGVALIFYSAVLLFKKSKASVGTPLDHQSALGANLYVYGALISFFVAFAASFLGIGGGIIHVPLLSHVLGFPVHLAAGTSHFILALTAWVATAEHIHRGDISIADPVIWQLGLGAVIGAQCGARLSRVVPGRVILKILGAALLAVGVNLVVRSL